MALKILVVDDEPTIRSFLHELLAGEGYAVATAAKGDEALAAITTDRPGLLITDTMMPRLGGLALIARARLLPPPLPIILMSAAPPRTLPPAPTRFIAKPFALGHLLCLVADLRRAH